MLAQTASAHFTNSESKSCIQRSTGIIRDDHVQGDVSMTITNLAPADTNATCLCDARARNLFLLSNIAQLHWERGGSRVQVRCWNAGGGPGI
eukprot:1142222-Pelagomonas_calceolata.AAC.1